MRKFVISTLALILSVSTSVVYAYNFGDFRSSTLTTKAWSALEAGDTEGVLAYTNKCIELYGEEAQKMQNELDGYPKGEKEKIFSYWALNDVATSLYIQGEAYRTAGMDYEAEAVFSKLIEDYSYGQAWDPKGWFWKPAEAAEEKLVAFESGTSLDFGDSSSTYLVEKAWQALNSNLPDAVVGYVDKVLALYGEEAKQMQDNLDEYPWESDEQIMEYWALNDVGTALFIKGEALRKAGDTKEAREAYEQLVNDFYYAQCWDPNGWFWKPSEAAVQAIGEMGGA